MPIVAVDGPWVWIFRPARGGATFFGATGQNRFDPPRGVEYRVLYAADGLAGAFIEVFGRQPTFRILSEARLAERHVAKVRAVRPLRLVDLRGPGLARIGATAELWAGSNDPLARR